MLASPPVPPRLPEELRKWLDELDALGPSLAYFPNATICWLVIKPEKEKAAKEIFGNTVKKKNH